jgi:hypothetical protein
MVLRADKESSELGGHIASFQSAATLYDAGFMLHPNFDLVLTRCVAVVSRIRDMVAGTERGVHWA